MNLLLTRKLERGSEPPHVLNVSTTDRMEYDVAAESTIEDRSLCFIISFYFSYSHHESPWAFCGRKEKVENH